MVTLDGDDLAGEALLWGIDAHNRTAHLGISLWPAFRGRGRGSDVVWVLCHYGFVVLGLHRLQIETLSDNAEIATSLSLAGRTVEDHVGRIFSKLDLNDSAAGPTNKRVLAVLTWLRANSPD